MSDMISKISEGLERAFASRGFAAPSVEDLRDAAGVSLRTLYKYTPSRAEMVLAAMENRHQRYVTRVFDNLPKEPEKALEAILSRVGKWMGPRLHMAVFFMRQLPPIPAVCPFAHFLNATSPRLRRGPPARLNWVVLTPRFGKLAAGCSDYDWSSALRRPNTCSRIQTERAVVSDRLCHIPTINGGSIGIGG